MAIGRISGSVLKSNLTRNGTDLAFETNLLYLDVTNSRVGIGTSEPATTLQVSGTTTTTALSVSGTSTLDGITVTDNTISTNASNSNLELTTNGTGDIILNALKINGTTISSDDSTKITINENLDIIGTAYIDNTANISSMSITAGSITDTTGEISFGDENLTTTGTLTVSGFTFPSADGSNGQVLQTDGAGNITFAESSGGGGGNNTAVKQFDYFKLGTTSAVIDDFDRTEFRGAIYDIEVDDTTNNMVGHYKVSIIHDNTTPYISVYDVNEDSTRIVDFSVAISENKIQLSAVTNTSTHTNLRCYRVALGEHHETVANTNSKIIATSTTIGSAATTLDQFTKTDIRSAKYIILIRDNTNLEYQISEMSLVHDGTTVYFNDYAKVSSRATPTHTFSASISDQTVTLSALSTANTSSTAILYRIDLGLKTKLGEYDNVLYGKMIGADSFAKTMDEFDVFQYRSAKYFVSIAMDNDTEYQNSEITLTVNSAGTDATISETLVRTGTTDLGTFTADVSGGKARLRFSGTSSLTSAYYARKAIEANNIYRASSDTTNNLYITHDNLLLEPGAIRLPKGTTAARPTNSVTGMIRYNTTTDTYERYDTTGWTNIATQAAVTESADVSTGEQTSIGTTSVNIDTFTTGTYDSAFYLAVTKDEINDEVSTAQISLMHDDTTAFVSAGGGVQSGDNPQLTYTADINAGTVRLRGSGTAAVNSIKFYKIGIGDATTESTSGNTSTIINTDVDSAVENIDTWAHASYRGAKYYISCNNATNGEVSNIECLVVHNGSDAFITAYNEHYSGNNSLITLTTDISGTDVRLRASCSPNTAVKMYRVLLSDSESDASSTNTKVVGQTTTSSSATTMDTFTSDTANGAHYVVVGNSTSEGAASVNEVFVVTDGSDAYVSSVGISTKGSDQLSFTAALSGTTVTVSSASTSGASTTVNAYRVQLLRPSAGAATSEQVLVSTTQTISGAKTFSNSAFVLSNLPTSDPQVAGQLWRSGNDLKISTG